MFMEFMYIYVLIFGFFFSILAIAVLKLTEKKSKLDTGQKDFITRFVDKKTLELDRSRTGMSIKEYFLIMLAAPVVLSAVFYFMFPDKPVLLIVGIVFGIAVPDLIIQTKRKGEDKEFSQRFAKALSQMSSSLNSGMSFEQAIDSVVSSDLIHPSMKEDFQLLSAKIKLGTPIRQAFQEFAETSGNDDVHDTAITIAIMMDIGKDEGQAIREIQKSIEDRLLYRKKRASMMAESELMIKFGDWMPVLILLFIYVFMPSLLKDYMASPTMTMILIILVGMMFLGSIVTHKLIKQKKDIA